MDFTFWLELIALSGVFFFFVLGITAFVSFVVGPAFKLRQVRKGSGASFAFHKLGLHLTRADRVSGARIFLWHYAVISVGMGVVTATQPGLFVTLLTALGVGALLGLSALEFLASVVRSYAVLTSEGVILIVYPPLAGFGINGYFDRPKCSPWSATTGAHLDGDEIVLEFKKWRPVRLLLNQHDAAGVDKFVQDMIGEASLGGPSVAR